MQQQVDSEEILRAAIRDMKVSGEIAVKDMIIDARNAQKNIEETDEEHGASESDNNERFQTDAEQEDSDLNKDQAQDNILSDQDMIRLDSQSSDKPESFFDKLTKYSPLVTFMKRINKQSQRYNQE